MQSLFDENNTINQHVDTKIFKNESDKSEIEFTNIGRSDPKMDTSIQRKDQSPSIERIVWFYSNNSFEEYIPRR
jgi:hypothetical protein